MKYTVLATMEVDLMIEVEAKSREDAMEKAENIDAARFSEDGEGDFRIYDAVPSKKSKKRKAGGK